MIGLRRPELPDVNADVIIIGAGLAGLTLAKSLHKSGKTIWVLGSPYESQIAKGGEIRESSHIPQGTVGLKYMEELMEDVKGLGINLKTSLVTSVDFKSQPMKISTKFQKFFGKLVVIATGAKQPRLNFPGEEKYFHNGISDCAVCDGNLFRGRNVAIIGEHKYTLKSAMYLHGIVKEVSLLWTKPKLSDSDWKRLKGFPQERIFEGVESVEALGSDVIERVKFSSTRGAKSLEIDALFVEGKPIPNSELFKEEVDLDHHGAIIVDDNHRVSIDGVFSDDVYAIGDVTGIVASADGILDQVNSISDVLHKVIS